MLIKLYQDEGNKCDIAAAARMVNNLQYFFVVQCSPERVRVPAKLRQDFMPPTPEVLAKWFVRSGLGNSDRRADRSVLIVSSPLQGSGSGLFHPLPAVCLVSDHSWRGSKRLRLLKLVRAILHAGMAAFGCHSSVVKSCICSASDSFDCLCEECESYLRGQGFRDGIYRLKDVFNLLNQLGSIPNASLPKAPLPETLRLAVRYANEVTAIERTHSRPTPLQDHLVLLVLHFLSDLVPFVKSLRKLGARFEDMYLVAKPYPYARRDEVSHTLSMLGVNAVRASQQESVEASAEWVLRTLVEQPGISKKKLVVIEDGGYFAPLLHKKRFKKISCVGVVEQTQKGINTDREAIPEGQFRFPILSVAESRFKKVYESPEIGRVAIQNISRFTPNTKLSGRHAVVVGFGSVGREVAFHLTHAFNMTVSVVENRDLPLVEARHRKTSVADAAKEFGKLRFGKEAVLVVGTTGRRSIDRRMFEQLPDGVVLVSTSSDQVEFDLRALENLSGGNFTDVALGKRVYRIGKGGTKAKKLVLLAEGYPINFYGSESLPNDTIDPIMTLLLLCGAETAMHARSGRKDAFPPGIHNDKVDDIVERWNLVGRFLKIA